MFKPGKSFIFTVMVLLLNAGVAIGDQASTDWNNSWGFPSTFEKSRLLDQAIAIELVEEDGFKNEVTYYGTEETNIGNQIIAIGNSIEETNIGSQVIAIDNSINDSVLDSFNADDSFNTSSTTNTTTTTTKNKTFNTDVTIDDSFNGKGGHGGHN